MHSLTRRAALTGLAGIALASAAARTAPPPVGSYLVYHGDGPRDFHIAATLDDVRRLAGRLPNGFYPVDRVVSGGPDVAVEDAGLIESGRFSPAA